MAPQRLASDFRSYLNSLDQATAKDVIELLQANEQHASQRLVTHTEPKRIAPTKIQKKTSSKKKSESISAGPKRPLNSWMAFRNYYSVLLTNYTQKATSKVLTAFWQADPFKAKWAILAKAYSTVRGTRAKADAPLDAFFAICAPLIGVIAPNEYLQRMGWQLGPLLGGDQIPQIVRAFQPQMYDFPEQFTMSTLSAEDLVVHCCNVGYLPNTQSFPPSEMSQVSLTMAANPTTTEVTEFASAGDQIVFAEFVANFNGVVATNDKMPFGKKALLDAEREFAQFGTDSSLPSVFDPQTTFTSYFDPSAPDPNVSDEGAWNAFDASDAMSIANFQFSNDFDEMFPLSRDDNFWNTLNAAIPEPRI